MAESTEQFGRIAEARANRKLRVAQASRSSAPENPAWKPQPAHQAIDLNSSSVPSGRISISPEESVFAGPHNVKGQLDVPGRPKVR